MNDTIYALSSGAPPAAIGVIRVSGPQAGAALTALAGELPPLRKPVLRRLRDTGGEVLDEALVLWFPGPATATGEDLAELQCHGGRAVIAAVLDALGRVEGLREAEPGEFTRRAFANGRIDLAQAEGLADLLSAETEWQRRQAILASEGTLSRRIEQWRETVLGLASRVEAALDFSDEGDVGDTPPGLAEDAEVLAAEMRRLIDRPSVDRLKQGVRVVFGGPPNSGKSSLFNYLLEEGAAIVSAEAGTTRDVIERPVAIGGIAFVLVDTAGIRDDHAGEIEATGIARARAQVQAADIVLWLGDPDNAPEGSLIVRSRIDIAPPGAERAEHFVSSETGEGVAALIEDLCNRAGDILPPADRVALNRRQKAVTMQAVSALEGATRTADMLVVGEELRAARVALDGLSGRNSTEDMLDALFGRFCIGK